MFMQEWRRIVCSGKFWGLILILLLLNGIFFEQQQYQIEEEDKIYGEEFDYEQMKKETIQEYKKLLYEYTIQDAAGMEDVLLEYQTTIKEGPDGAAAYQAMSDVIAQMEYQKEYSLRFEQIRQNAEDMLESGLFQGTGTFAEKNVLQTVKDYEKTKDLQLEPINSKWLISWMGERGTDAFLIILIISVVLQFFAEQKNGLWYMVRSTRNGRLKLAGQRVFLLFAVSVGSVVLFYGEIFVLANRIYGPVRLSAVLQSAVEFEHCVFPMTVGGFLFRICFGKVMAVMAIGLLLWVLLLVFQKSNLAVGIMGFLAVSECILYLKVSDLSNLKILKYCNLFAMFDVENIYMRYVNVNVFGFPINAINIVCGLLGFVFVVTFLLVLVFTSHYSRERKGLGLRKGNGFLASRIFAGRHVSLVLHEGYKLLFSLFGIAILVGSVYLAYRQLDYSEVLYSATETYKNRFYQEMQRKTEAEAESYIVGIENEIIELQEKSEGSSIKAENMQSALSQLLEQKEYLRKLKQERNIQGEYVNPLGYNMLIGEMGKETMKNNLLLQIFLIAIFVGGYMAYENQYQMMSMIRSTKKKFLGVTKAKIVWIVLGSIVISSAFMMSELDNVLGRVGLANLSAPVQSLDYLQNFPFVISCWQYILFVYMLRMLFLIFEAFVATYASSKCHTVRNGIILSVCVTALPVLFVIV